MSGIVNQIVQYESGQMDQDEQVAFFSELVKSGLAWQLQGHYGRMARSLIIEGYLTEEGAINTPGWAPGIDPAYAAYMSSSD